MERGLVVEIFQVIFIYQVLPEELLQLVGLQEDLLLVVILMNLMNITDQLGDQQLV